MNKINNKNKGITLIALVITIIVMLILVAVTISMAVNGGLFDYAGKATGETQNAIDAEQQLASGKVTIGETTYNSIDEYLGTTGGEGNTLPTYAEAKFENGVLTENAIYTSGKYTAVIPKGFKISEVDGEKEIATGLVIKDANNNEFVWIPVTEDIGSSYSSSETVFEPGELTGTYSDSNAAYDSQATLDYLYGENYYNYEKDFKYVEEYEKMVEKVNEYNGFYIGRYETTIDSDGNIGAEYNTPVLTAATTYTNNSTTYYYRWYGLYYAQKNADVTGNGTDVQTAMIYKVLWGKTMEFIRDQNKAGNTTYDVDTCTSAWHRDDGVVNSAQANPGVTGDVALNIWDLESNAYEWTQLAITTYWRRYAVSNAGTEYVDSASKGGCAPAPASTDSGVSSRLVMLIK